MRDLNSYIREVAEGDFECGQIFDRDDYSLFRRLCAEDGYTVTEEDFNTYFDIVDECRDSRAELEESLPSDSAYLHARTGDKVCYNGKCYEVNADEGKIGYSDKIGLTSCDNNEKIVLDKNTFANEVKMYKGKCESINIVEELQKRDYDTCNDYDLYNCYIAADLSISNKTKLAEMLRDNESNECVSHFLEGLVEGNR